MGQLNKAQGSSELEQSVLPGFDFDESFVEINLFFVLHFNQHKFFFLAGELFPHFGKFADLADLVDYFVGCHYSMIKIARIVEKLSAQFDFYKML